MQRTYSGDRTILMACSICGTPFEWPTQGRYCSDRLFRGNDCCPERKNRLDYEREQQAAMRSKEQVSPPFPMGPKPQGH